MFRRWYDYATANIGFYFALFILLWIIAWTANALWQTKFDLAKLEEMGKFVLGKYGVDSGLNTKFQSKEIKTNEIRDTV